MALLHRFLFDDPFVYTTTPRRRSCRGSSCRPAIYALPSQLQQKHRLRSWFDEDEDNFIADFFSSVNPLDRIMKSLVGAEEQDQEQQQTEVEMEAAEQSLPPTPASTPSAKGKEKAVAPEEEASPSTTPEQQQQEGEEQQQQVTEARKPTSLILKTFNRHIPMNMIETKDGYILKAELPGVAKENIDINIHDNDLLTITANKVEENLSETDHVRIQERRENKFSRTIALPDLVDHEKEVESKFENGVVELKFVKKVETDKRRKITIA